MIQEISKLCRHLFRENICYETLQLLPALNRWALLRLMIVKYELYDVSEQPTAMLLQHTQCWHLFIYCQSALKAALTSKLWGLYISASLGYWNRKFMNASLNGCDYNQTDNLIWARMAHGHGWQRLLVSVKIAVFAGGWSSNPSNSWHVPLFQGLSELLSMTGQTEEVWGQRTMLTALEPDKN